MKSDNKEKKTIKEKEKELIIARLKILVPEEMCFASGDNFKGYTRNEIITEIKKNSQVGKDFIKTEMEFLRAIKDGSLIKKLNEAIT